MTYNYHCLLLSLFFIFSIYLKYETSTNQSAECRNNGRNPVQLWMKLYIDQLIQLTKAEIYQKMLEQPVRKRHFIKITRYCYFL